jgi:uncharacterized protein YkwD
MLPNANMTPAHPRRTPLRLVAAGLTAVALLGGSAGSADALAKACADRNALPTKASPAEITRATLCLVNAERRDHGLRPLQMNSRLSAAARRHSRDMVRRQYFEHTAPGGPTLVQRIRRTGYLESADRWLVGENIGWGASSKGTAHAIVDGWMHSPPHRKAILTGSYRDAGVGVIRGVPAQGPSGGATYTLDFGVKR